MVLRSKPIPTRFLLQNGDRFNRVEFERRSRLIPHHRKVELIEGEVYLEQQSNFLHHGEQDSNLGFFLKHYTVFTSGTNAAGNTTVRLDLDNEPQPDQILFVDPAYGGNMEIDGDGILSGSPELVAEVSGSSVSIDLGRKLNVYRRNGVKEYLVWRVFDDAIDWFALRNGTFEPIAPDSQGVVHSHVFPGLCLDVKAMLGGQLPVVLATLQKGLSSPDHAAFVARLAAAKK